jgi:hypothetical protein
MPNYKTDLQVRNANGQFVKKSKELDKVRPGYAIPDEPRFPSGFSAGRVGLGEVHYVDELPKRVKARKSRITNWPKVIVYTAVWLTLIWAVGMLVLSYLM